ncbi:hypothetical protein LJC31_07475 [Synergistaceae bacterium OttesenSCG-928-I11]|nr:hypothetical protein [Synergistaceae bacterium OttesenSCG-928-I11]
MSDIAKRAAAIRKKDESLKLCMSVYEYFTSLRTGLDFSLQCDEILALHDAISRETLESIGVSFDEIMKDRDSALAELGEKALTEEGRDDLFRAMNDLMDFADDQTMLLNRLADQQSRMARTAFHLERKQKGIEDSCVEVFLRRRTYELRTDEALKEIEEEGWEID